MTVHCTDMCAENEQHCPACAEEEVEGGFHMPKIEVVLLFQICDVGLHFNRFRSSSSNK